MTMDSLRDFAPKPQQYKDTLPKAEVISPAELQSLLSAYNAIGAILKAHGVLQTVAPKPVAFAQQKPKHDPEVLAKLEEEAKADRLCERWSRTFAGFQLDRSMAKAWLRTRSDAEILAAITQCTKKHAASKMSERHCKNYVNVILTPQPASAEGAIII